MSEKMKREIVWFNVCQVIDDMWMLEEDGNPHIIFDSDSENFIVNGNKTLGQIGLDTSDILELLEEFERDDKVRPQGIVLSTTLNELVDKLYELINA